MKNLESPTGISIEKVLFATDFSPATEASFSYAAAIADRYQARLYVAYVINLESFDLLEAEPARVMISRARDEASRRIARLLEPLGLPPERYEIVVAEGAVAEVLLNLLERNHIDLAVFGSHGRRAFKKVLLGSIAEEVFRMASCPVLTVGPKTANISPEGGIRHILYPLQFAPDSSPAARYAVSLAERYGATLTVMNVSEDLPAAPSQVDEVTQPMKRWIRDHVHETSELQKRVRFERGFGPATGSILDFASKANVDLIVMSVRRLDPVIAAHLPSAGIADDLVGRAACPVLTIRE